MISTRVLQYSTIFIGVAAVAFVVGLLMDDNTFSTNKDLNDEENSIREKNRGMLMSILSSIVMNAIGRTMIYVGIPEGYIVINYGYVLAPVIGYLLDVGFATKAGLLATKKGGVNGVMHAVASLASPQFFRYLITVLLDMFISSPIKDAVVYYLKGLKSSIPENSFGYGQLLKANYPFLLGNIVEFTTYYAYINNTRYRWAYTTNPKNRVPTDIVNMATAISASLFVAYTLPGAENLSRRIPFALAAIALLSIGNSMKWDRKGKPPVTVFDASNEDVGLTPRVRFISGSAMLVTFMVIGIVIPLSHATKPLLQ